MEATEENTYQIRPSFWNVAGMGLGGILLLGSLFSGNSGTGLGIGFVLAIAGAVSWLAKKAIVTDKYLIVKTLFRRRTLPFVKMETIELSRGLLGYRVAIAGTGSTHTLISAWKSELLHDKLEAKLGH